MFKKGNVLKLVIIILLTFTLGMILGVFFIKNTNMFAKGINGVNTNKIAIINEDQAQEYNGDNIKVADYYIGRILQINKYDFEVVSAAKAEQGIENDFYAASIKFPSTFTQSVLSVNEQIPLKVRVEYKLNDSLDIESTYELENDMSYLAYLINNSLNYIYLYGIFEGLHKSQNYIDDIIENNEKSVTYMDEIGAIDLLAEHDYELDDLNNDDFEEINLDEETNKYKDIYSEFNQNYMENIAKYESKQDLRGILANMTSENIESNVSDLKSLSKQFKRQINAVSVDTKDKINSNFWENIYLEIFEDLDYDYKRMFETAEMIENINGAITSRKEMIYNVYDSENSLMNQYIEHRNNFNIDSKPSLSDNETFEDINGVDVLDNYNVFVNNINTFNDELGSCNKGCDSSNLKEYFDKNSDKYINVQYATNYRIMLEEINNEYSKRIEEIKLLEDSVNEVNEQVENINDLQDENNLFNNLKIEVNTYINKINKEEHNVFSQEIYNYIKVNHEYIYINDDAKNELLIMEELVHKAIGYEEKTNNYIAKIEELDYFNEASKRDYDRIIKKVNKLFFPGLPELENNLNLCGEDELEECEDETLIEKSAFKYIDGRLYYKDIYRSEDEEEYKLIVTKSGDKIINIDGDVSKENNQLTFEEVYSPSVCSYFDICDNLEILNTLNILKKVNEYEYTYNDYVANGWLNIFSEDKNVDDVIIYDGEIKKTIPGKYYPTNFLAYFTGYSYCEYNNERVYPNSEGECTEGKLGFEPGYLGVDGLENYLTTQQKNTEILSKIIGVEINLEEVDQTIYKERIKELSQTIDKIIADVEEFNNMLFNIKVGIYDDNQDAITNYVSEIESDEIYTNTIKNLKGKEVSANDESEEWLEFLKLLLPNTSTGDGNNLIVYDFISNPLLLEEVSDNDSIFSEENIKEHKELIIFIIIIIILTSIIIYLDYKKRKMKVNDEE